ncbi:uncharacterized protein LY89DRAFT_741279 [Mollisia scopiformis]|uniref:Uncharacterized protein n=1 Tax=Mollisia scopiformis TaxID=149040 RepID=A0A132BAF6_MOLSC|nr:uncharacterized protein LY89DRAFT_741279 [Mollisia scopiformis]KUJ08979.1 hypothetical protein LY89DRAFT_741279 [Mollisia scopiformis]
MTQPNDAFSESIGNITGLLNSSIADIDILLNKEAKEPIRTTPTEREAHAAKAADFEDALQRIKSLEGSLRYYRDDSVTVRKAFDNLKKDYQNMRADTGSNLGSGWGSKQEGHRDEIRKLKESLEDLRTKSGNLEKEHQKCSTESASQTKDTTTPDGQQETADLRAEEHKEEVRTLKESLGALQIKYRNLEKNHKSCISELESKNLAAEDERLTEQTDVLLSKSSMNTKHNFFDEELITDNIVRIYDDIQTRIQRIVRKFYYPDPSVQFVPSTPDPYNLSGAGGRAQRMYHDLWLRGPDATGIINRARGIIFQYISEVLLSQRTYDLHDLERVTQHTGLEHGLRLFEHHLMNSDDKDQVRTNHWRLLTMNFAKQIKIEHSQANNYALSGAPLAWVDESANQLKAIMDLTSIDYTKIKQAKDCDESYRELKNVCEIAYHFAILLRRSEHSMRIEIPKVGDQVRESDHIMVSREALLARHDGPGIQCAVSGTLVTYVFPSWRRLVNQEAKVVV